jgi:hypothetical protein
VTDRYAADRCARICRCPTNRFQRSVSRRRLEPLAARIARRKHLKRLLADDPSAPPASGSTWVLMLLAVPGSERRVVIQAAVPRRRDGDYAGRTLTVSRDQLRALRGAYLDLSRDTLTVDELATWSADDWRRSAALLPD